MIRERDTDPVTWNEAKYWSGQFGWKLSHKIIKKSGKPYHLIMARKNRVTVVKFASRSRFDTMVWTDFLTRWRAIEPFTVGSFFPLDGGPPHQYR